MLELPSDNMVIPVSRYLQTYLFKQVTQNDYDSDNKSDFKSASDTDAQEIKGSSKTIPRRSVSQNEKRSVRSKFDTRSNIKSSSAASSFVQYKFNILPVYNPRSSDKESEQVDSTNSGKNSIIEVNPDDLDSNNASMEEDFMNRRMTSNELDLKSMMTLKHSRHNSKRSTLNIPPSEYTLDSLNPSILSNKLTADLDKNRTIK